MDLAEELPPLICVAYLAISIPVRGIRQWRANSRILEKKFVSTCTKMFYYYPMVESFCQFLAWSMPKALPSAACEATYESWKKRWNGGKRCTISSSSNLSASPSLSFFVVSFQRHCFSNLFKLHGKWGFSLMHCSFAEISTEVKLGWNGNIDLESFLPHRLSDVSNTSEFPFEYFKKNCEQPSEFFNQIPFS